ncbi:MAG: MBOAT family protein [Planctomycetota bacterium]|nr:MAG: MBOAT family protein [Planctomycetota bacterium]
MLFNSYVFLLVFLPLCLGGYVLLTRAAPRRVALGWLVAASLVYYGWFEPRYLALLGGSLVVNFALGVRLARFRRKRVLALGVALNLLALAYFKYAGLLVRTAAELSGADWSPPRILLPIGISFFTFQQIAYLVDAHRAKTHEYHPVDYSLFVTFFPQLIAGPIVHHGDVLPQFERPYRLQARDLAVGASIFAVGLAKKVLLADEVARYATPVFQAADAGLGVTTLEAWLGTLAYALQLYFDFSGYSDMAIGLGRVFGVRLPLNFDSPYKAVSVVDFWRRWHMTLSRFLRDYLYIPLGGNRRGKVRRYLNLLLTMFLGGLWHGAGWNFALWGLLHGGYLCLNHAWSALRLRWGWAPAASSRPGRVLAVGLTFLAALVAWVPFRAETFAGTGRILAALVGCGGPVPAPSIEPLKALGWVLPLLGVVWLLPNTQELFAAESPALDAEAGHRDRPPSWSLVRIVWRPSLPWALGLAVLAWATLLQLATVSEFLYYQF